VKPAYWTAADKAELDGLVWELVCAIADHQPGCETCRAGYPPCLRIGAAIEAVVDWQHRRRLLSHAEHLRSGQDLLDFGGRLGYTPEQVRALQTKWRAEEAAEELAA
jgi:hypothetical protein